MKNAKNFIPKRYLQPDRYELIFNSWCAVYAHPVTGQEIMIEAVPKYVLAPLREVSHLQVLVREKKFRSCLVPRCRTIKEAVDIVQKWLKQPSGSNGTLKSESTQRYRFCDYNGNPVGIADTDDLSAAYRLALEFQCEFYDMQASQSRIVFSAWDGWNRDYDFIEGIADTISALQGNQECMC